jgi:chondroitin 4-sulfotransferase 11
VISHKHKFIFVHIPKTGGSSVEIALEGCAEELSEDIHEQIQLTFAMSKYTDNLSKYFKFCFVRNPWERLVSNYFYKKKRTDANRKKWKKSSFGDYVLKRHGPTSHMQSLAKYSQLYWITDYDENICVDFIGRFENLQEDFNIVCDKIGIPKQELPHTNKSKHKHYTEYYDDETKEIVAKKYAKDIEYFGYKFGE